MPYKVYLNSCNIVALVIKIQDLIFGQNIAKLAIVQRKEKPGGRMDVRNSTLVA